MSGTGTEQARSFPLFGSRVRLLALDPQPGDLTLAESLLRSMHTCLTRFDDSELRRLNGDPREQVSVSPLLARALLAAERAMRTSGGLVDVTVLPALERAGYERSRVGLEPADLETALAAAPPRAPAGPLTDGQPRFRVDGEHAVVHREPGVRIDLGGIGKGLAADLVAGQLEGAAHWAVDCGGDIRLGGRLPEPRTIAVHNPFTGLAEHEFGLEAGAIATSGLSARVWEHDGGYAHHLIDPRTGRPAWTGVVQATALAPTAGEAETLAKTALLSGPERGLELLGRHGGALITDERELLAATPSAATRTQVPA